MLLYRCLLSLFALWELPRSFRRGGWPLLKARLGRGPALPDRPHVWLHGASNGELASARPVLEELVSRRPDLAWVVTCNSPTGLALVEGWALPGVATRPAPLDLAWVSGPLLRRWRVVALITLEAEIWPHRVLSCPGPVMLLGARMSARTARGWSRLPRFARRVLGRLAFASAQNAETLARLRDLGLPDAAAGPVVDLKSFYTPPASEPSAALRGAFARAGTWLAASTHEGEERIVLDAHRMALRQEPDLRLILAPRHPLRARQIRADAEARGLFVAQRSLGEAPGDAAVYLADTMGEMALWYALAGRVFVGGTLSDRGGHTPYEPSAFGAALLHGPDVANFAAPYARLSDAGAARRIADAEGLAGALNALSSDADQRALGAAAAAVLTQQSDLDALSKSLAQHLPPPPRA